MIDRNRALTSEDLIRRYDLESLKSNRKAIQNNKNGLDKTENILNNFILSVLKGVSNTENQVDGKITTWFYNYEPTLNIVPTSNWTTDALKNSHLGDLFYNKNTGYVYMFDIVSEVYQWIRQTDESTIQAMAIANSNPDTSDGYRDIFVIEPTTPYKVGDIWFKEDGSIYRCNVARASGDFNDAEWIPSNEYSNDNYENDAKAIINDFKQTITTNYICKVLVKSTRDSIELSVESITGDYAGTLATLNSRITQINNSIMLEVNKKINATDITGAYLVLKINGDSSSGKLSADKIDITASDVLNLLAGNTINLTSNNIAISSDNFSVNKNGLVTMINALITGGGIHLYNSDSSGLNYLIVGDIKNIPGFDVSDDYTVVQRIGISITEKDSYNITDLFAHYLSIVDDNGSCQLHGESGLSCYVRDNTSNIKVTKGSASSYMTPTGMWSASYNNTSLESEKKNIEYELNALKEILSTDIVNYNWKFEDDADKKHIGTIISNETGNYKCSDKIITHDRDSIDIYSMVAMSWKAIQEQNSLINELIYKIKKLEGE